MNENPKDYYKLADNTIDDFISNDCYIDAFIRNIIDSYIDTEPAFSKNIESNTENEKDDDRPLDFICELYEITGKDVDFEVLSEFKNNMKSLRLSVTKLIDIMEEEHGNIYKERNETKKKVYVHGIKKRGMIDSDDEI